MIRAGKEIAIVKPQEENWKIRFCFAAEKRKGFGERQRMRKLDF